MSRKPAYGHGAAQQPARRPSTTRSWHTGSEQNDPVLAQRLRIARWARIGRSTGYSLYGLALAALGAFRAIGIDHPVVTAGAAAGLIAGTVLLGPAIIVGYTVKAADRADREGDW